jgi:hypothetical protein
MRKVFIDDEGVLRNTKTKEDIFCPIRGGRRACHQDCALFKHGTKNRGALVVRAVGCGLADNHTIGILEEPEDGEESET